LNEGGSGEEKVGSGVINEILWGRRGNISPVWLGLHVNQMLRCGDAWSDVTVRECMADAKEFCMDGECDPELSHGRK